MKSNYATCLPTQDPASQSLMKFISKCLFFMVTVNCTVMYMSQCMSGSKCKATCTTTGATAYRWFFDGCCECVGSPCINYGVNESRCIQCPMVDEDEYDEVLTDQYLAGNSADNFDEVAAQRDIISENDPAL
ncbi:twisted gastrulation-like [Homarus americanus]|uniref:Twisted gastrulation-like n=1 Tax=Homarus americanus TaxID=6706 RepID=A0A8J5JIV8_HOMAM|nr:twisted gastrulation-like [Homarus americanus]